MHQDHDILVGALASPACAATDAETGRARGFAHVEFTEPAAAAAAVQLNGQLEMGGRTLKLDVSESRGPRNSSGGGATPGFNRNGGASDGNTIFVKGFGTDGEPWQLVWHKAK